MPPPMITIFMARTHPASQTAHVLGNGTRDEGQKGHLWECKLQTEAHARTDIISPRSNQKKYLRVRSVEGFSISDLSSIRLSHQGSRHAATVRKCQLCNASVVVSYDPNSVPWGLSHDRSRTSQPAQAHLCVQIKRRDIYCEYVLHVGKEIKRRKTIGVNGKGEYLISCVEAGRVRRTEDFLLYRGTYRNAECLGPYKLQKDAYSPVQSPFVLSLSAYRVHHRRLHALAA